MSPIAEQTNHTLDAEDVEQLLKEVNQGSKQAFDLFYETYFPLVFGVAMKIMKNKYEAEDVCQEVLLDFLQRPHLYQAERGSVEAFLAVKTRHKCVDMLRRRERQVYVDASDTEELLGRQEQKGGGVQPSGSASYVPSPAEYVVMKERREAIRQALHQIPEEQRVVLQGAYLEELTQRHLAEQLNKPLGTIKSLIRYGLRNMRRQLRKYVGEQAGGGERE